MWLIDRNRIQAIGGTEDVLALEPLDAKLDAFGFQVVAADGHDFASLLAARDLCTRVRWKVREDRSPSFATPSRVTAFAYMQETVASHYLPMNDAQYEQALDELSMAHAAAVAGARDAG